MKTNDQRRGVATPVADFLDRYDTSGTARFHMPGHKGAERHDITEIDGAGDLFSDKGIIAESERVASDIFSAATYYSTEGSSLAIRTMIALAVRHGAKKILAGRNAHRSFLSAAILLDLEIEWIYPAEGLSYLSCDMSPDEIARLLDKTHADAVYITSPDYLGYVSDVGAIAKVCHDRGAMLLVDSAHGAYLKFLEKSLYPTDLEADMCASSAHKTLPVLTGGAYLHLSERAEKEYGSEVKETMELFATSSPSYLITRSLDLANRYLANCRSDFSTFAEKVSEIKKELSGFGYTLAGDEPFKITVQTKPYGYAGNDIAQLFTKRGVIPEFHDPDYLTFMLTPCNTESDLLRLVEAAKSVEKRGGIIEPPPAAARLEQAMTPREAFFAPSVESTPRDAVGKILSSFCISCPPAVPVAVSGEIISHNAANALEYYGIEKIRIVK